MKATTKCLASNHKTKEPVTIDQWFFAQDAAVDKTYARMRKKTRTVEVQQKSAPERQKTLTDRLIGLITTVQGHRSDIEEELGLDFAALMRFLHTLPELNAIAIEQFALGTLDTKNHKIHVIQEMVHGKPQSRIVINGQSLL